MPGAPAETNKPGLGEFIALMAFTMSLVALSIDAMLPAFPGMARDLQVETANDIQLVVSFLFIGLAIGQLFYGPLSDSTRRKPFTLQNIKAASAQVIKSRMAMVYMLVAGCVSGAFLSYLNTSQQIFQGQYGLGMQFPLYFGILALAVGSASLLNSGLVMRFGMHALANGALLLMMLLSWLFLFIVWAFGGHPPLGLFMAICLALFFCIGVLFGNLNSIAMEPLGHVAGTAAAVIGSSTTLLAVVFSYLIGRAYDGSLYPMAFGFVSLTSISIMLVWIEMKKIKKTDG